MAEILPTGNKTVSARKPGKKPVLTGQDAGFYPRKGQPLGARRQMASKIAGKTYEKRAIKALLITHVPRPPFTTCKAAQSKMTAI